LKYGCLPFRTLTLEEMGEGDGKAWLKINYITQKTNHFNWPFLFGDSPDLWLCYSGAQKSPLTGLLQAYDTFFTKNKCL
jgi:hypothetical protein